MQSQQLLSRRDFLKLLAAAGAVSVGGHVLNTYAPWVNYDQTANHTWRSFTRESSPSHQMLELIRYATLAANGHNAQPWRFAIQENAIEIHPDLLRQLPVVDPHNRALWISLGCALENLLVAARAAGFTAQVTYPDRENFIHIALSADKPQESQLVDAIALRQNTRSEYDGQMIKNAALGEMEAIPLEPGIDLLLVNTDARMDRLSEYVHQATLSQYTDKAFVDELSSWLRFNKKDAVASLDGLYTSCSGNPEVPGWLGRMVVASTKPQQQADADARLLLSSACAVVIASSSDQKTTWVRTGQVYERLALTTTLSNIRSAFCNQPVEVEDLRSQFQAAFGLGSSLPQLLVRFGYANLAPRSLRRPVEQVML